MRAITVFVASRLGFPAYLSSCLVVASRVSSINLNAVVRPVHRFV